MSFPLNQTIKLHHDDYDYDDITGEHYLLWAGTCSGFGIIFRRHMDRP